MQVRLQGIDQLRCCDILIKIPNLQKNCGLLQDSHTTYYSQIKHSRWMSNVSNRNDSPTLENHRFKFTHNFIICDQLPEMELIFGIDIQRKFSISYAWDKEKNYYIQKEGKFLTYIKKL